MPTATGAGAPGFAERDSSAGKEGKRKSLSDETRPLSYVRFNPRAARAPATESRENAKHIKT